MAVVVEVGTLVHPSVGLLVGRARTSVELLVASTKARGNAFASIVARDGAKMDATASAGVIVVRNFILVGTEC